MAMNWTSGGGVQTPKAVEGGSVEEVIRLLRVLWFGLLMGQILFTAVLVFVGGTMSTESGPAPSVGLFYSILGVAVLGAIVGQIVVERGLVASLRERSSEIKRAADPVVVAQADYRAFFVKRSGLVEGVALLAGVTYMVTGTTVVLLVSAASILLFLLNYPAEDRVRRQILGAIESA